MVTGIGNLCYVVDSLFALVLVGVFFAIPYRRLKLSSTGQILDRRFGSKRRQWLASLCVQTEYLIININIIEPFVFGTIVSSVTGLPFVYGVYFGGIVILTFAATVGLRAPLLYLGDFSWLHGYTGHGRVDSLNRGTMFVSRSENGRTQLFPQRSFLRRSLLFSPYSHQTGKRAK